MLREGYKAVYLLALVVSALLVTESLTLDLAALFDVLGSPTAVTLTGVELARCSCCCCWVG